MTEEELVKRFEQENITLASLPARTLAFVIDELLVSLLFISIYWNQFSNAADIEQTILIMNTMVMYVVLLKVLYQGFFVWMYGATPGKMLAKIKVIYVYDVNTPTLGKSLVRAMIRVVSETIFYLGFFWAMLNPKRESWHDKAAGTLVVNA
ncbi:MAG: RDD family protein [Campylobacterales bacterium]|nr:RDD family protein [Campylobacterales bacterium]